MARKVYHVVPHDAGWAVKLAGGRVLKTFETKEAAISFAVATAKNNKPSQVVVHGKDGKIQEEWTYGDDPHPPPG